MQLMRWSITRRLESREKHKPEARICQPDSAELGLSYSRCSGEENDSISDEESAGGIVGDAAVDLTAARSNHEDEDEKDPDDLPVEEDEEEAADEQEDPDEDEEGSRKRMRNRQDAENNNSFIENAQSAAAFPPAGTSHVTLEALQNTTVAVAQIASTAMAGGADSEAALQELAVIQNTLYSLQHQHTFHLQWISQLQQQLSITQLGSTQQNAGDTAPPNSKEASPSPVIHPKPLSSLTSPPLSRPPSHQRSSPLSVTPVLTQDHPAPSGNTSPLNQSTPPTAAPSPPATTTSSQVTLSHQMPALCSISSSLASSIITNNDPMPLHEPNTLEMLQKRAQEVLDNASQGLLANNLADELAFRSGKGSRLSPYDSKSGSGRSEPFFKHRCRYCGKVFGSDSALQIHIRSHTGERPFKCNVCGSRFTTKGNLKVHFQRHRDKFPHVKMNPNPIPEHLDKYHPHLLQQLAACGQRPLSSPPPPPPPPHHPPFHSPVSAAAHGFLPPQPPLPLSLTLPGMPSLYRSPLVNHRDDQDMPENLSKPLTTAPARSPQSPGEQSNSHHSFNEHSQRMQQQDQREEMKEEQRSPLHDYRQRSASSEIGDRITPKREPDEPEELADEDCEEFDEASRRYLNSSPSSVNATSQPQTYEDCSMDSKISGRLEADGETENDEDMEEQPENLSGRGNSNQLPPQSTAYPGASPASSSASSGSLQNSFANILFPGFPPHPQLPHHPSSTSGVACVGAAPEMVIDPARDPAIYSNLLPRPGSNDNSWESLIEITKTSETSKLQQLVDNIDPKVTDPNQCILCQRVLSCKSALQMHYRTHTGERPFKCKICGRAFTTKGNLKTHMSVHRAKPPLRVLHQCPVCHKKFSDAFVLQQHTRLHKGEPTDLSPEQIQAAEVNDFSPVYHPHHPLAPFLPQAFPALHPVSGLPLVGYPHSARAQPLDLHSHENDADSKESEQQQKQLQLQLQQRFMEEQCEEMDDGEDDEEDRRDDDERSEDNRENRLADGEEDKDLENDEQDRKPDFTSINPSPIISSPIIPSFSTSLAALENQVRTITTMATNMAIPTKSPPPNRYNGSEKSSSPPSSGAPLDLTPRASSTPASVTSAPTSPPTQNSAHQHPFGVFAGLLQAVTSPSSVNSIGTNINSIANINVVSPGSGAVGPLASLTTSAVRAATSTYNPLGLAVSGSAVRGNTTCNICYKTFACNSALEIHYRSHTKERPFKCTICDRGFSTKNGETWSKTCDCANRTGSARERPKSRRRRPEDRKSRGRTGPEAGRGLTSSYAAIYGDVRLPPLMPSALGLLASEPVFLGNMKQHMLTHKIRDMPPHLFSDAKQPIQQQQQLQPSHQPQQLSQQQPPPQPALHQQQQQQQQHQHQQQQQQQQHQVQDNERSRSPFCSDESSLPPPPPPPLPPAQISASSVETNLPVKRTLPETDLPAPKRPPSMSSKHLCHVCNKNFSSSSALQIHMRTHTGDKPFRCTICQKAFTTKGNLKVHWGTHMSINGTSRRGRRMSLDIPSLQITPKDSEFLQRRPDLFYPYLPAPFLNGVPQKLNEISVIQSNNGLPVHPVSAGKYAGLFGSVYAAGGFPLDKQSIAPSNGPLGDGSKSAQPVGSLLFQTPSPSHSPGTPSSNTGNQNSASMPPWSGESLQHHFDRETPSRSDNDTSHPAPRLPPPAPRGEGLAA